MEKTSISIKRGRRGLLLAAVALSALHAGAAHATVREASAVPELSTWAMLTLGFAGLGFGGWARRARANGRPIRVDAWRRKVGAGLSREWFSVCENRFSKGGSEEAFMRILLFRLRTKSTIACIAAAIGFGLPGAAEAQQIGAFSYGSTFTGDAGATITYSPDYAAGYFFFNVYTGADIGSGIGEAVDGAINGAPASLSLGADGGGEGVQATPFPGSSVYVQEGGAGGFEFDDASGAFIAGDNVGGGVISATPGQSTAVISYSVYSTVETPEGLEDGPVVGYLVLTGETQSPVSLSQGCSPNPAGFCIAPYFNQFTLDFTATYQATPYEPPSGKAVPELSTWAMLALGFAGLGLAGWARSAKRGALAGPGSPFV
jgi:hypothetical protein